MGIYAQKVVDNTSLLYKAEESFKLIAKNCNVPVVVIDLDSCPVDSMELTTIIDMEKEKPNAKYYIAKPIDVLALKDTILILDYQQNAIFASDYKGNIKRMIGRKGKGPVEFENPAFLKRNKNYYIVYDHTNARIQILDNRFRYVKSLITQFLPLNRNIAVSKDYLFLNSFGNKTPCSIDAYSLMKKEVKKTDFIDKSFGFTVDMQQYNFAYGMKIAASIEDNSLFVVCGSVPFAFNFNASGKLEYAVKFKGRHVIELTQFNDPSTTKSDKRVSLMGFVNKVVCTNKYALFSMPGKIYVFDRLNRKIVKALVCKEKSINPLSVSGKTLVLQGKNIYSAELPVLK